MKKVLIIDDNPINNSKYIDELKKVYDVTVALRMLSAIRLLKKNTWDVVVIDVMMPTQILSTNNEMKAGFDFYEQKVKNLHLSSKIVFWSRLNESCFDGDKYPADKGFCFVHKSVESNHLRLQIDKLFTA